MLYIDQGRFYKAKTYILILGMFEVVILPNVSSLTINVFNLFNKIFMSEEKLYILEDNNIYQEKLKRLSHFVKSW